MDTRLSRRSIVKSVAWSVPVVTAAAAAPAFANASPGDVAPLVTINGAGPSGCALVTIPSMFWSGRPSAILHVAFNAPISTFELPSAVNDHTIPANAPQGVKNAVTGNWMNHYAIPAGTALTVFIGAKSKPTFYYWFEDGVAIFTATGDPDAAVPASFGGTPGGGGPTDPPRFYFNNKSATGAMVWTGKANKFEGKQDSPKIRFKNENEGKAEDKKWSCSWSAVNPKGEKGAIKREGSNYPDNTNTWPTW